MALSAFPEKSHPPTPAALRAALGPAAELWDLLLAHMAGSHGPTTELWNHSGPKTGWSLRLKRKERVLLYLTPQAGRFLLGVVLGEKAAQSARGSGEAVLALIDGAPRYAEGRGIRLQVATPEDLAIAKTLADLKMTPGQAGLPAGPGIPP